MKILITGGYGFIGNHLYRHLIEKYDCEVYRSDFDITDFNHVRHCVRDFNPDIVFHLAANPNTKKDELNPTKITSQNVLGTHNLLEACSYKKNIRFVYTSSCAVYGNNVCDTQSEEKPTSVYGLTKLAGESYVNMYKDIVNPVIIRLAANVGYGAKHGLLPDLFRKFRENKSKNYMVMQKNGTLPKIDNSVTLLGKPPGSIKPFTYVGDTVNFLANIGLNTEIKPNQPLIVSNKDSISVEEVANIVKRILFSTKKIEWTGESWPGDNPIVKINCSTAEFFGWQPVYNTSVDAIERACRDLL